MQCLFKGMSSLGSIYTTTPPQITSQSLKKYKCDALILISSSNKNIQSLKINHYLSIIIKEQDHQTYLCNFDKVSNFIEEIKKITNIVISSTKGQNISVIFFFAYLIQKYQYTFEQIESIYQRKLKKIQVNFKHFQRIKQYLNEYKDKKKEVKIGEKEKGNFIQKRIKRIGKQYQGLIKKSQLVNEIKYKQQIKNPQKKILFDDLLKKMQQKQSKMLNSQKILKRKKSLSLYKKSQSTNIS